MSRNIKTTNFHIEEEIKESYNTQAGKLLFTKYSEKMFALFLQNNRLMAAQVLSESANRIGAVYIGKIKKVVKNIDACFLEIADGEICFLQEKEAVHPILLNRTYDARLLEGDEILVQISKEAQKSKQASVTAHISLSNEYAAISIGSAKTGYSGKLSKERKAELKEWLTDAGLIRENHFVCDFPHVGLVVRTKAANCTREEFLQNVKELQKQFLHMLKTAHHRTCFSCMRQAPEDFETVLDQLVYPYEYEEILTDDSNLYEKLLSYCHTNLPHKSVRLYEDTTFSLTKLYSLKQKFDTALNKHVWLKSGGYLVIEPTEALTVIDVNTGKYESKKVSWDTYEKINKEAAEEIALQLRLRNLSGMIIVDFINMNSKEKEESLLTYLRELVRKDKMKTVIVDMTPLGLVEITRKKGNKPLWEQLKND